MKKDREPRESRREIWLPLALIGWRLLADSPSVYWKDWMLIAGAFWVYTIFKARSTAWPVATVTVMAYLLGIYLLGQMPHALVVLGIGAKNPT